MGITAMPQTCCLHYNGQAKNENEKNFCRLYAASRALFTKADGVIQQCADRRFLLRFESIVAKRRRFESLNIASGSLHVYYEFAKSLQV
jgi:hypothetical protein